MYSFKILLQAIQNSYTGGSMRTALVTAGFLPPARLTYMYLNGESNEYILAACLAIAQIGE